MNHEWKRNLILYVLRIHYQLVGQIYSVFQENYCKMCIFVRFSCEVFWDPQTADFPHDEFRLLRVRDSSTTIYDSLSSHEITFYNLLLIHFELETDLFTKTHHLFMIRWCLRIFGYAFKVMIKTIRFSQGSKIW